MRALITGLCMFAVTFGAQASIPASEREQFVTLYSQIQNKGQHPTEKQLAKLAGYPLYPYLVYASYRKRIDTLSQSDIDRFIKDYADTPLTWQLNRAWLNHLFQQKQWQAYRKAFDRHPASGGQYDCQLQIARINTSAAQKALRAAPDLWSVGHSQDSTCDPLFSLWQKQGGPTSAQALKRFWLAIEENNLSIARYAEQQLKEPSDKAQAELYWDLRKQPEKISTLEAAQLSAHNFNLVLIQSYKRWARKSLRPALDSWLSQREVLSPAADTARQTLDRYFSLRLATDFDPQAERLISHIDPQYRYEEITEWRIRLALTAQNWRRVHHYILKLPDAEQQSERWRYWFAVARSQLNDQSAHLTLQALAKERSFYGFLAAEISDLPFRLNKQTVGASEARLKPIRSNPGIRRAQELFQLGMIREADREWYQATRQLSSDDQLLAGHLALGWGWHNRAITAAISAREWDTLDIRFPAPHRELFAHHAGKQNIDRTWPLAIARQESAFMPDARSHAGARGLMQLMPATAKLTAKKHKLPYKSTAELGKPDTNIALGTAYLGEMYQRFGQNKAYATAAYNAGPHRVDRWLQQRGNLPLDIWIETIPFKETRNYVQNVLAFRVIYDEMNGQTASLLSDQEEKQLALRLKQSASTTL